MKLMPRTIVRRGQRGEAVRDVQDRLLALGYAVAPEERGTEFAASTEDAVREFQQRRGLAVDGIVGPETWRELVEASWRLGDRALYLRAPHLRGDDVRALQDRLSALGFHHGRVDGIFGPETAASVREFQRNYGMPSDGIVGDATVRALAGLPGLGGDTPVGEIREREALRRIPPTLAGMRIVIDPGHGAADSGWTGAAGLREAECALRLARRIEALLAASGAQVYLTRDERADPSPSERAAFANQLGADLYLSLHAAGADAPGTPVPGAYYFGHERFHSHAGRRLAELVAEELSALGARAAAEPKTFSVLRETRMPAVQIEPAVLTDPDGERRLADPAFLSRVAEATAAALRRLVREPVPAASGES